MNRYLHDRILSDLAKKMVLISGPRQVGKTFLSKQIATAFKQAQYLNYDDMDDAAIIDNRTWSNNSDLLILDEIHKKKKWKQFLKGTVDTHPENQSILVTGSARLDTFRQSGESLAGRYFHFHLNPLSVKELSNMMSPYEALEQLNKLGGFPEPFLSGSDEESARWRNQYYTDLIREDILEFSHIKELRAMRLLIEMLRRRVGSPLSISSLAGDLKIAPNTVAAYLDILERLHVIFMIRPFHTNIARAIQKTPKFYFYDSGYIIGDTGIHLENTVAISLKKHIDYLRDVFGREISLHYIRTKDKKEIDFSLAENGSLTNLIEVKTGNSSISKTLLSLTKKLNVPAIQIVQNLRQPQSINGIEIARAADWLTTLSA
jgi:predicted AAA+ superfamily ATPase